MLIIKENTNILTNNKPELPPPVVKTPETIPHIVPTIVEVLPIITTTEEYTFDAIPFQHSRKRVSLNYI